MRCTRGAVCLSIFFCLLLTACEGSPGTTNSAATPVTLNVFAAASLTESFKEIAQQYQATHPTTKITYNFNGSQILEQQIASGARADVFASADLITMKKASDAGLVREAQVFAKNKLVVMIPASNPGSISTLKDLAKKGIKIAVAAPTVPAGKYGLQVLDKMSQSPGYGAGYKNAVKANFVSQEENVKAVVQKVEIGEVDAGIVYQTDVTAQVSSKVKALEIPEQFNVIAQYPIALTKDTAHASDAQAFIQFVLSPTGQAILEKYRFTRVK